MENAQQQATEPMQQATAEPKPRNPKTPWANQFHRFLNQPVSVVFTIGDGAHELIGKLTGYNAEAHHVIVESSDGSRTFVRYPLVIRQGPKDGADGSQAASPEAKQK
jgi:hypothetical protein